MKKIIKFLFEIEKNPRKGMLPIEWAIMGYLLLTTLLILFAYTKLHEPEALLLGRFRLVMMTLALWAVYRLVPCRFTLFWRIVPQMLALPWWYTDTYALNIIFPNLDHWFAGAEQRIFGCQPALTFAEDWSHPVVSELMHMGYSSYYPLIVGTTLFFFFWRNKEFERGTFIITVSFFIYYAIYIFLPVTGPQYYYLAAGLDNIASGVFPDIGNYFATHRDGLPIPGYSEGFFYQCVANAHKAGECPTAAFPSSHVGITAILLLLAWRVRSRLLFWGIMPFFLLICLATVYIQAHYAIDVAGGWISAVVIYAILHFLWGKICPRQK